MIEKLLILLIGTFILASFIVLLPQSFNNSYGTVIILVLAIFLILGSFKMVFGR